MYISDDSLLKMERTRAKLENILTDKGVYVEEGEDMASLVEKVNDIGKGDLMTALISGDLEEYEDSNVKYVRQYALRNLPKLKKISISNVEKLTGGTFVGDSALEEFKEFSLQYIDGADNFNSCSSLKRVIIPNCVLAGQGGVNTCSNCSKLQIADVKRFQVMSQTFKGCSAFKALIIRDSEKYSTMTGTSSVIDTLIANGTGYIYVPQNMVDGYKALTNFSVYADQIVPLEGTIYEDINWSNKPTFTLTVDTAPYELPIDTTVTQFKNTFLVNNLYLDGTELSNDVLLVDYKNMELTTTESEVTE